MAKGWDSAWIDFSKGLGAPIGGVLAGTAAFIDEVWRWKQRLGGSMRQAGICAAACIHALDHHVDRLADDHANARALARGLSQIAGIEVQQPETNLVFFKPDGAGIPGDKMVAELRKRGVLLAMMDGRIRACTHLDVTAEMIEETVARAGDCEKRVRSVVHCPLPGAAMPPEEATALESASAPVNPGERLDSVDILRGIALLGVLAVNVVNEFRVDIFEQFLPPPRLRRLIRPSRRFSRRPSN